MKKYDVVVIGAGPGGMTAALYAARANLSVAMLDRGVYGGQMNNTDDIENYPGFTSIKGPELSEKMYQSAINSGVEFVYGDVQQITLDSEQVKHIKTDSDELIANAVIIATGATHRKLGVPGEDKFAGKGVSYCAVCDGAFLEIKMWQSLVAVIQRFQKVYIWLMSRRMSTSFITEINCVPSRFFRIEHLTIKRWTLLGTLM